MIRRVRVPCFVGASGLVCRKDATDHFPMTASASEELVARAKVGYWVPFAEADAGQEHVFVQITDATLDVARLTHSATDARCGAIASFLGTTRDHFDGKAVERLEYEAYTKMALKAMAAIGRRAAADFAQVHKVVVAHRVGCVPVGEASVIILVATEHRRSGLDACAWAIDELKRTVPIWKKEIYADGTVGDGCAGCQTLAAQWKSNPEFVEAHPRAAAPPAASAAAE
jgi:molybdopterin synthase catalytic subunit